MRRGAFLCMLAILLMAAALPVRSSDKSLSRNELESLLFDTDLAKLVEVFQRLQASGFDTEVADEYGRTLLFAAVGRDRIDVAEWLLQRGANVNAQDQYGDTVLHAIAFPMDNPVKAGAEWGMLFVKYGADLNARDNDGDTALCLAAASDRQNELLVFLISAGADINIGDNEGNAPLSLAIQHESAKNAAVLRSKGARQYSYQFPADNAAAPCKAVLSKDLKALAVLPKQELSRMNARTALGVPATALHLAAEQGDLSVIRALCARKVDWNVGDRYDRSPLQLAVLADNADVTAVLLENGADPNRPDSCSSTAFSWACAVRPDIALLFLARGLVPEGDKPLKGSICSGDLGLVKALVKVGHLTQGTVEFSADLGQVEIADYLGSIISSQGKSPAALMEEAGKRRQDFGQLVDQASRPIEAAVYSGGISAKRGTFPYILESWSPWKVNENMDLAKYPVGVYVPKDYDGSKPFGLFVSMTNAKSSSRYPRDFTSTLDRHHLIWVGFDPYNGLGSATPAFCIAIVHNMLGYFSIDRSRIYIGGFSLGGQMTDQTVHIWPGVFKGMVYIGYMPGATTVDYISHDPASLYFSRKNVPLVLVEGDYDYCRLGAYENYDSLLSAGYRNIHFVQEPMIGHRLISAESFEKAVSLLEPATWP
jgi:ankyrin repeat protein/predicted esterase